MTTNSLTKEIKKVRTKIDKGGFKGNEESELHMRLDGLRKILNGLERLEKQLEHLNRG